MSIEDSIIDDVLALDPFPPKPGGLVDRHRHAEAARKAAAEAAADAAQPITERAVKAVKTAPIAPEGGWARTIIVSTAMNGGAPVQLLGADPMRLRAVVVALDQPIVLATELASASDTNNPLAGTAAVGASGFVLPVNVPLSLQDRHEWFVVATSATAARVSVIAETYAPSA